MRPLRDNVVILQDEHHDLALVSELIVAQTKAGIVDSQSQLARTGTVIAVGPGKVSPKNGYTYPMQVKPGDRVAYGEFDYPTFHENGTRYVVISEADIVGIWQQNAADAA